MAEYVVKRPVKRPPIHPGEIVREEVLPALGLSVSEAAASQDTPEGTGCFGTSGGCGGRFLRAVGIGVRSGSLACRARGAR